MTLRWSLRSSFDSVENRSVSLLVCATISSTERRMARPRTGSLEERGQLLRSHHRGLRRRGDREAQVVLPQHQGPRGSGALARSAQRERLPAPSISPHAAQTVKERGVPWHAARKARGVKQWDSELGWLENHIYPKIGHLPIGTVRPAHLMEVINSVIEKKLSPGTIEHIRLDLAPVLRRSLAPRDHPRQPDAQGEGAADRLRRETSRHPNR